MAESYLIAHCVRGEAAFDVATQMECPHCNGHGDLNIADATFIPCFDCDSLGFWWIIPTSGHRAYPYWSDPLQWYLDEMCSVPEMPPAWPDHYKVNAAPKLDITSLFKATQPPQARIARRL